MNILSLFDGISCGRLALEKLKIPISKYYASEIDKYAIKITQKNFPDTIQLGDITKINFKNFKIDLLMGGSPCTYWSIANKNRATTCTGVGFELFMHFVRAINESKSKYFLYENNFSIHKNIQKEITKQLKVTPILINSSLVSAQNRKRLYWTNIPGIKQPEDKNILLQNVLFKDVFRVGRIVGRRIDEKGKRKDYSKIPIKQRLELRNDNKTGTLTTVTKDNVVLKKEDFIKCIFQFPHGCSKGEVRDFVKAPTLTKQWHNNFFKLIHSEKAIRYMNRKIKDGRSHWDFQHHSDIKNSKSASVVANFFRGVPYNVLRDLNCIRKFHPVECERLQTIPDNYTYGVSNTQRYKLIGNAWTVDVIKHILSYLNI